jgi:tetratricopeptide (TPR) repeat protein
MHLLKTQQLFVLIALFMLSGEVTGQVPFDTLTQAQSLKDMGKTKESMKLLIVYYQNHPDDLYTNWIYAQTAFQAREFRLSKELYLKAIDLSPHDASLQLDFAKSLLSMGEIDKAAEYIQRCTETDPENPENWYYLASIDYWQGENRVALALLDNILVHVPNYDPALQLKNEIILKRSPWLSLGGTYSRDDQPMDLLNPFLKGGWYRSNFLGPDIQLNIPVSFPDSGNFNGIGFNAGNNFYFKKSNLKLYLNIGLFSHTSLQELGWTTDLKLEKKMLKHISLRVEYQRKPYLMTLSSLKIPLFENDLSISMAWDDPGRWNGQISFLPSTFSTDNNYIAAIGGWILAPNIKAGRFIFQFGYGYAYSDSKENRFVAEKSLNEIVSDWSDSTTIAGIYNPYFTPNDQQVHSILALINYNPAKKINLSLNINAGIYGTTMYPYLFLDGESADSLFINRNYTRRTFHPFNISAGFTWQMTKRMDLSALFNYNSTIYYTTKSVGITIRKRF